MNTIGGDIISLLFTSLEEVNANFQGLVIGNQGQNFSAGANLMLLMMEAAEGNWDEIDLMVRTFQATTQAMRYAAVPVVVAPADSSGSVRMAGYCFASMIDEYTVRTYNMVSSVRAMPSPGGMANQQPSGRPPDAAASTR